MNRVVIPAGPGNIGTSTVRYRLNRHGAMPAGDFAGATTEPGMVRNFSHRVGGCLNILFISFSSRRGDKYLDPSTRYRCYHMAEEIRLFGHVADVCHIHDLQPEFLERYDVFVFHRPKGGKSFFEARELLRILRKPVLADFDDLVFRVDLAEDSPLYMGQRASLRTVRRMHRSYANALASFDTVLVSTPPLAERVREVMPEADVYILPNGLSARWVRQGLAFGHDVAVQEEVIGYFPGTSSHHHDFPVATDALRIFLEARPGVRLRVVGPLKFSRAGFRHDQVEHLKPVPYYELPRLIRSCRVTIAPLAETTFNACKSGLKFFESAIWGVPVIGSPIMDMARHAPGGVLLPQSGKEWREALEMVFDEAEPEKRAAMGRAYVLKECMAVSSVRKLVRLLQDMVNG